MVIIVAAIAGITRLAIQQRREQKKHLLDDFRVSLERLARQPLPAQGATPPPVSARKRLLARKRRYESPRGEWDRVALDLEPKFFLGDQSPDEAQGEIVFAPEVEGHDMGPVEEISDEPVRRPARRRKERKPLLAGRLWRAPREPWLWTYSKPRRQAQRSRRVTSDVEYVDFARPEDVLYANEGNHAYASRPAGSRSPHSAPPFVGPHDSVRRGTGDAAARRQEARRRTGSRLS